MAEVTREQFAALRAEVTALTAQMESLKAKASKKRADAVVSEEDDETDYSDAFARDLIGRLRRGIQKEGSAYGLAVTKMVSQTSTSGSTGTAFSIVTIDKASNLPTDENIAERVARAHALIDDPLTLLVLRRFVEMRFEGKPMRATAGDLGAALGTTPEAVDAALRLLVDNGTLQRQLSADNTVSYQWDGNNHLAMALLIN